MPALTLDRYIKEIKTTPSAFAKSIGRSHQIVYQWIQEGAHVDLTQAGIKIVIERQVHPKPKKHVVHETQVAK